MTTHARSIGYRPDIEGLRAIAVILVVLAHSKVPGLSGGFIGVDVFFVISGYLITGLLVNEISQTGQVNLSAFYARRLKRLAPALFIMIALCLFPIYVLIAPLDQTQHFNAAATASVWLSNFHFAFQEVDYFSANFDENIFLHTWSLSVEEQFYLVWPTLIILLWIAAKKVDRNKRTVVLISGMLVISALSFAISWTWTSENPAYAYFLSFSRAWQFALGGMTVLIHFHLRGGSGSITAEKHPLRSRFSNVVAWAGFALIAYAVLKYTDETPYPGSWAILPTIGTALLLFAGATNNLFSRIISTKPWVRVGQLSYGWYLWHWPFLIFARVIDPSFSIEARLLAISGSFLAAWLSKNWMENPIRYNRKLNASPKAVLLLAFITTSVVAVSPLLIVQSNYDDILTTDRMEKLYLARSDVPKIYHDGCDEWMDSSRVKRCDYGDSTPEQDVFLVGDSVLGQWFSAFSPIAKRPGWRLRVFTKSACPMVDEPYFYSRFGVWNEVCDIWRESVVEEIVRSRPKLVILGSSSNYKFSEAQWTSGTRDFLDKFANHVGEVIIIRPTPVLKMDITSCIANRVWQEGFLKFKLPSKCQESISDAAGERIFRITSKLANRYDNVRVVDLNKFVCPDNLCSGMDGEVIVFRDKGHLTDTFVSSIVDDVSETVFPTQISR